MPQAYTTVATGTLIRGRYRVKQILGVGTNGAVYLVRDERHQPLLAPLFALKEIGGLDQQVRTRLALQSVALQHIRHPALPVVRRVFQEKRRGCVYLLTELVEGSALEDLRLTRPEERLTWTELRPLVEPIMAALTFLHTQEPPLIHGDLKPANVILSRQGQVRLVDLCSVRALLPEQAAQAQSHTLAGHLAPECFGGLAGPAADIYSLGATLYTLLTGQTLPDALMRQRQVRDQQPDPLPLASDLVPAISLPLALALHQALSLYPGNRFASVEVFWEALLALPDTQTTGQIPASASPSPETLETAAPLPIAEKDAPPPPLPVSEEETPAPASASVTASGPLPLPTPSPPRRRILLTRIALICAGLLLLLGMSLWACLAGLHHANLPHELTQTGLTATPPMLQRPQPRPSPHAMQSATAEPLAGFPALAGTYIGDLQPVFPPATAGSTIPFTLSVQGQRQGHISGTFTAASHRNGLVKNNRFIGIVTRTGQVQFTVLDADGNAIFAFDGRLTRAAPVSPTFPGGQFHSCTVQYGTTCQASNGPLSGSWIVLET